MINFAQFQPVRRAPDITGSSVNAMRGIQMLGDSLARRAQMREAARQFDEGVALDREREAGVQGRFDAERERIQGNRAEEIAMARRQQVAEIAAQAQDAYGRGDLHTFSVLRGQLNMFDADVEPGGMPEPNVMAPPYSLSGAAAMGLAPAPAPAPSPAEQPQAAERGPQAPALDPGMGFGFGGLGMGAPPQGPADLPAPPSTQWDLPSLAPPMAPATMPAAPEPIGVEPPPVAESRGSGLLFTDRKTGESFELGLSPQTQMEDPEPAALAIIDKMVPEHDREHYKAALGLVSEYMVGAPWDKKLEAAMKYGEQFSKSELEMLKMQAAERRARISASRSSGGGVSLKLSDIGSVRGKAHGEWKDLMSNIDYKGSRTLMSDAKAALTALDSGNPSLMFGVVTKIARLEGQTGVLTNQDVAHLKRTLGISGSVKEWLAANSGALEGQGQMSEQLAQNLREAVTTLMVSVRDRVAMNTGQAKDLYMSMADELETHEAMGNETQSTFMRLKLGQLRQDMESFMGGWLGDFFADKERHSVKEKRKSGGAKESVSVEVSESGYADLLGGD